MSNLLTTCRQLIVVALVFFLTSSAQAIISGAPLEKENPISKLTVGVFEHYQASGRKVWLSNCAGSVLGDRFILTAAHCLVGKKPEDLAVNFSSQQIKYSKESEILNFEEVEKLYNVVKVKAFKIHPRFGTKPGERDIAVIFLDTKIPESAVAVDFLPEELLARDHQQTTFESTILEVILVGAGHISEDPDWLQADSFRWIEVPGRFVGDTVETQQEVGGACKGDSGGPGFVRIRDKFYQVGVISGPASGAKNCHDRGLLSNPSLEQQFIKETMREFLRDESSAPHLSTDHSLH